YNVGADVWSATSFALMRREALACEEWNRENPDAPPRTSLIRRLLEPTQGPVLGVSDWVRSVPDQISRWVPRKYVSLGTDGFGMSDTREALRRRFGIDGSSIALTVLVALAREGRIPAALAAQARRDLGLDGEAYAEAAPVAQATPEASVEAETVPAGNGKGNARAERKSS
ncbi:MAG TPA: hypothetical protein VFR10_03025, partial [bacterium]|nr:hypothetical protein [bacterium]